MSETLDHDLSCDEASGIGEPASMALWFECYQFLVHEVALLDDNRMEDWLALLGIVRVNRLEPGRGVP